MSTCTESTLPEKRTMRRPRDPMIGLGATMASNNRPDSVPTVGCTQPSGQALRVGVVVEVGDSVNVSVIVKVLEMVGVCVIVGVTVSVHVAVNDSVIVAVWLNVEVAV